MTIELLFKDLEDRRDEIVSLTRALVQFPTINPPGDAYEDCARWLGNYLSARGFSCQFVRAFGEPGDSDRYPRLNVIARYEFSRPGPVVHFNGHIDVVETGLGWTFDPFAGDVKDGRIYGRGTCDMKGGIAAAIIAADSLIRSGLVSHGAIEVSGTVDEESGGFGGVGYLAKQGFFAKNRLDHVIIPEPLNVDRVCIGHRGVWWAKLSTFGKIAHGSMPFFGDCAVRHMSSVIQALEEELYPKLASKTTMMPVVPDQAKSSTLNLNAIHGGPASTNDGLMSPSVVDQCSLVLDRRFIIEEDLETVKKELTDLLEKVKRQRPGFTYELEDLMEFQPVLTSEQNPVPQALKEAIEAVQGKQASFVCSPGSYDQKHLKRIAGFEDCVAYGPGILDLAHQADEYVIIDDLVVSAKTMAFATLSLLEPGRESLHSSSGGVI